MLKFDKIMNIWQVQLRTKKIAKKDKIKEAGITLILKEWDKEWL